VSQAPLVVIGTGFAGFGAGHRLEAAGTPYVVYDRNSYVGGHTASHELAGGFIFDQGPHVSFAKDERIQGLLADAVQGRYEAVRIGLDSYWQGRTVTHPVQVNLHGLPVDLTVRILMDLVAVSSTPVDEPPPGDYETWLRRSYGDTFAETFPMPYGLKYHTTPMANLTTDWLGPRMYRPSMEEALRGALSAEPQRNLHYVTHFRYPTEGGYAAYLASWAARTDVRLNHRVIGVDAARRILRFEGGRETPFGQLISSIPLPDLVPLIDNAPEEALAAARRLAFSSVVLVNLGVDRPGLGGGTHIRYVYDADIPFSRISFPHRLSPQVVPQGTSAIQVEWYFSEKYKPLTTPPDALVDPTVHHLRAMGLIASDDRILVSEAQFCRYANVIYDHDRADAVAVIRAFLDEVGIHTCGRYGEWNHSWTDESFVSGERAAEAALTADTHGHRPASRATIGATMSTSAPKLK
jgi:protoporphyrinogen oxidase